MNVAMSDIVVHFGSVKALDGVSVRFAPGEVTVLAGPNGAGKSTLMGVLLGLVRPNSGRVEVEGGRVRERLGYLPEAVAFSESLTARQVMRFFARARGVERARIEVVLKRVGLSHAAGRAVRGFSRGMRQRLGLGVAILHDPELLVLDEPTGGLDQEGLALLWSVLAEWRERGRTVVLSTHDLALIERRADHVVVLVDGKVRAMGAPEALRRAVELPVRVRVQFGDEQVADRFDHRLRSAAVRDVRRDGEGVTASVQSGRLMDVLRLLHEEPVDVRVEEPGLDDVYESLLGGGRWDA